jgi:acyl carrier protein
VRHLAGPTERYRSETTTEQVRAVVAAHARLPIDVSSLDDDADLFEAGMTSHASVNVMLALEDTFDVEFPDEMLTRSVFESITAMSTALEKLRGDA